ncbi:hypothetical protein ACT7C1_11475 [Bacillus paranthracis]
MKQEQYNWKFKKMTDDPSFKEWHSNQDNISHSLNTLVSFIIRLIGTGDLGSFDNQTKLQQVLLLQDESFINAVAKRVNTCSSSSFIDTDQERIDEKNRIKRNEYRTFEPANSNNRKRSSKNAKRRTFNRKQ